MKCLSVIPLVAAAIALGACSINPGLSAPEDNLVREAAVSLSSPTARETMLLVSLDDGSVILQTISSSADLCFKMNSASTTTCLTQGAPVIDPDTNAIIGFEMIEDQIELVAKSD